MFLRRCSPRDANVAAELAPEVVEGRAGDHDPAGLGELLEAGGDVHPVAVDVLALDDHVAEVDADPEADALGLGHARLPLGHAALDRDRARDGVDDAGELAERAVAHELDDAAAVLGDERLDELPAVRLEARERAGLVALHQPASSRPRPPPGWRRAAARRGERPWRDPPGCFRWHDATPHASQGIRPRTVRFWAKYGQLAFLDGTGVVRQTRSPKACPRRVGYHHRHLRRWRLTDSWVSREA